MSSPMDKLTALRPIMAALSDYLVVACNGMIGREVHACEGPDRPDRFYMIGSMGIGSAIGLGVARSVPDKQVAILDGDGNVLMGMGNLAQIGSARPENLVHVCLDNGVHASTGGQRTIAPEVALEKIAAAAGYPSALRAANEDELARALRELPSLPRPVFLLVEVEPGTTSGIPRVETEPPEIARRFRKAATA